MEEHYHVTVVSPFLIPQTYIYEKKEDAIHKYNDLVISVSFLIDSLVKERTDTEATYFDGTIVRWFSCSCECLAEKTSIIMR